MSRGLYLAPRVMFNKRFSCNIIHNLTDEQLNEALDVITQVVIERINSHDE